MKKIISFILSLLILSLTFTGCSTDLTSIPNSSPSSVVECTAPPTTVIPTATVAPTTVMPTATAAYAKGITIKIVDGRYHMNFAEGNKIKEEPSCCETDVIPFMKEYEFAAKLKSLDFTDSEKRMIKKHWMKDEDGIIIPPTGYYYIPTFDNNDLFINFIEWSGTRYCIMATGYEIDGNFVIDMDKERYKKTFGGQYPDIESVEYAFNHKAKVSVAHMDVNGINKCTYSIQKDNGENMRIATWQLKTEKTDYYIVEKYAIQSYYESRGSNPEYPAMLQIYFETEDMGICAALYNFNQELTPEYVKKIGVARVNTVN